MIYRILGLNKIVKYEANIETECRKAVIIFPWTSCLESVQQLGKSTWTMTSDSGIRPHKLTSQQWAHEIIHLELLISQESTSHMGFLGNNVVSGM